MLVCEKKKKTAKVKRESPKIQRGKYIFNTFPIKMVNTAFRLLFLVFFFLSAVTKLDLWFSIRCLIFALRATSV